MKADTHAQRRHGWRRTLGLTVVAAWVVAALAVVAGQGGCTRGVPSPSEVGGRQPILVSIAASTTDAVQSLADRFTADTKLPVTLNAGDSSTLAAQIVAGAPAALFLSANRKWADFVNEKGLAVESTPLLGSIEK
jgi:ABC-type molybdate transport system substrate-binding protein